MNTEQIDSTKVNQTRLVFMEVIDEAMQDIGKIEWESVELVSRDEPDLGDAMYTFSDCDTHQVYRILFKRSSLGERGFRYVLFTQNNNIGWEKIAADFKTLN